MFFVALWAIEAIGTQRTFLVLALVPALVAAPGSAGAGCSCPLALVAALALPPGTTKPAEDGRVLYETETPYQYARVVELEDGSRRLELNEGQAIHSLLQARHGADRRLLGRLPGAAVRDRLRRRRRRGSRRSARRAGRSRAPTRTTTRDTRIDAVDIDPELFKIGHRYFGLQPRPAAARDRPGRAAVPARRPNERYDAIFVDAYRQPYIPFYLTTKEFFELVRDRLNPGGSVIVNIGHPNDSPRSSRR